MAGLRYGSNPIPEAFVYGDGDVLAIVSVEPTLWTNTSSFGRHGLLVPGWGSGHSQRYDGAWIVGAQLYGDGGLGVLGSAVPSTGQDGASFLYNDLTLPDDENKEVRGLITSVDAGLTSFFAYEDGSFEAEAPAGGTYTVDYDLFADGASIGSTTITIEVQVLAEVTATVFVNDSSFSTAVFERLYETAILQDILVNESTFCDIAIERISDLSITPSLFTNTPTFGTAVIERLAVAEITPAVLNNVSSFGATLVEATYEYPTVIAAVFVNQSTFGNAVVEAVFPYPEILATRFVNTSSFHTVAIERIVSTASVSARIFVNTSAFGTATIESNAVPVVVVPRRFIVPASDRVWVAPGSQTTTA